MKMWSLRVIILLLFCYTCLSCCNSRVRFISTNFYNVLQWDAAEPDTAGKRPLYTVNYKIYEDNQEFKLKAACQNITVLTCDLTVETPSNYSGLYLAQVLVNNRLHGYTRFKPVAHTHLGPPILSIYATALSLHINVTLPLGPKNISVGDIIRDSRMPHLKTEIAYTLQITEPAWAAHNHQNNTGCFDISYKKKATEFCGFVVYNPSSEVGRNPSDNASFCVQVQHEGNTPRPLPWPPLLLITAILLAVLLTVVVMYICHYFKGSKGVKTPETLKITNSAEPKVMKLQDCSLFIYKLEIGPLDEEKPYQKIEKAKKALCYDGYCPQDVPSHPPVNSSRSSRSQQSLVVYSTVEVQEQEVSQQIDGNNCFQLSRETDETSSKSPLPDTFDSRLDADSQQLLLDAVRDANGKLRFTFPLLGTGEETQRTPLLSDLSDLKCCKTWLTSSDDSGCNDSTLNPPTQPYCNSHYSRSGYKQNWMPADFIIQRDCEDTRLGYPGTWPGLKQARDNEEDEALAGEEMSISGGINLSSWMVQVQD